MSRRQIRSLLVLFALLLAASLIGASPDPERASLEARAIQVLDGDTIVLRGGDASDTWESTRLRPAIHSRPKRSN